MVRKVNSPLANLTASVSPVFSLSANGLRFDFVIMAVVPVFTHRISLPKFSISPRNRGATRAINAGPGLGYVDTKRS